MAIQTSVNVLLAHQVLERHTSVEVASGVTGIECDKLIESTQGFGESPLSEVADLEVIERIRRFGTEPQGRQEG